MEIDQLPVALCVSDQLELGYVREDGFCGERSAAFDQRSTELRRLARGLVRVQLGVRTPALLGERVRKVFTLSPWPLDLYWSWTRTMERADYDFGPVEARPSGSGSRRAVMKRPSRRSRRHQS